MRLCENCNHFKESGGISDFAAASRNSDLKVGRAGGWTGRQLVVGGGLWAGGGGERGGRGGERGGGRGGERGGGRGGGLWPRGLHNHSRPGHTYISTNQKPRAGPLIQFKTVLVDDKWQFLDDRCKELNTKRRGSIRKALGHQFWPVQADWGEARGGEARRSRQGGRGGRIQTRPHLP